MGHIPEDNDFDEYMNSSAEEWSKPEKPPSESKPQEEPTNRWGSPIQKEDSVSDDNRGASEPIKQANQVVEKIKDKTNKAKWWIIAILAVVLLVSCACVVLAGLEIFQVIDLL